MNRQPGRKSGSEDELGPRVVQRRVVDDATVAEIPERPRNEVGVASSSGHITFLRYAETGDNPAERLEQQSAHKEAERLSARKDKEHALVANTIQESLNKSMTNEEQIALAYKRLEDVKTYIERLKDLEGKMRDDLKERLLYKTKIREKLQSANSGAMQELARKLDEETNNHVAERKREVESKSLLNEIVRLKQNEEDVNKRITKLMEERLAQKERSQNDEHTKLKLKEKVDVKERLDTMVAKIAEKNATFAREYLNTRVLAEQVARVKGRGKTLVVLVPTEAVANPFQLQNYLKIGRHHKTITVTPNDRILEPEKHSLADLDERVGHVEMYAQTVDAGAILAEVIEKGLVRQTAPPPIPRPLARRADEFQDIVSLGGSEDEDDDAAEMVPALNEHGGESKPHPDSLAGFGSSSAIPEPKQLSEQAKSLASLLTPDPVRVFNDALILKKTSKKTSQSGPGPTIKVDLVISNDYVSTYFDNCVTVKLYYELEIFLKSLFYRNFEKVLKNLTFYSEEYRTALHTEKQRTDLNLHYHSEGRLPDVNEALSSRSVAKLITQDVSSLREDGVAEMAFLKMAQTPRRGDLHNEKQAVSRPLTQNLLIFMGVSNKGLLLSLLKLAYEDLGHFDNLAVTVVRTSFAVEVHNGSGRLQETFDNFTDFVSYFEQQVDRRLYVDTVLLSVHFELASKIDVMYSARKCLHIVALPFLQERQSYGAELKSLIKPHLTPLPSLDDLPQLLVLRKLVEESALTTVVAEMPHTITVSKTAPQQFEKLRKLADLLQEVSREDNQTHASK